MRILFVSPYVPSPIRVRPYQLVQRLSRRHSVTVLAAVSRGEHADLAAIRPHCERVVAEPLSRVQIARSCAIGALRGEPLQATYCRSPELSRSLAALIGEGGFDVVHVEHLRAAHLVFETARDTPVVYDAVDCISLLLKRTFQGSHSWRQRLIAGLELARTRAYERRVLERVDSTIVTSEDDAEALTALAPRAPITVLPNGVDLDYFRPSSEPAEPSTIVISGKMSYHANVTAVLHFVGRILPLIRRRHPDVHLRIVGSAPPSAILALQRDPRIEVTGYLTDIRPAIRRATVAICPVTVKVGIQNKILEAMALGVPVVSTAAGAVGLRALAGQDLLVGSDDSDVARAVCDLLDNPGLRSAVATAGRQYVEAHHRWEDVGSQLEQTYQAITSRTRPTNFGMIENTGRGA